jgi:hypothetical protein
MGTDCDLDCIRQNGEKNDLHDIIRANYADERKSWLPNGNQLRLHVDRKQALMINVGCTKQESGRFIR